MQKKNLFDKLFNYGCKLLKHRDRSVSEIKEKLRTKSSSEKDVEKIVEKLIQLGYLNDQRFVDGYINKWLAKGKSLNLIIYELKEKYGISDEILNKLDIENLKQQQVENIIQIVKKKYNKPDKKKIYNFLQYKGFSEEEIESMLNKLEEK
jgi:regulatory protein